LKRQQQNKNWLLQTLEDQLKLQFYQDQIVAKELQKMIIAVQNHEISPFKAAEKLLHLHHK
jgi:LAO/AO transport system kinase